jgi:hypothetical protein
MISLWATGWTAGVPFPAEQEIFLFSTASGPALGPTQSPIQWVPGALSWEVERLGRKADHSPLSDAKVKSGGAILPLPHSSSWRGI